MKKRFQLRQLLFLALCCDLGMISKRLVGPAANLITDALRIPGGVGTSFSLMFVVIAAALTPGFGSGTLVGAVQGLLALVTGRIGSMGALSPFGYIIPGIVTDVVFRLTVKTKLSRTEQIAITNCAASVSAGLTANLIVFRLNGTALLLYFAVAAVSGALCGILGSRIAASVDKILKTGSKE